MWPPHAHGMAYAPTTRTAWRGPHGPVRTCSASRRALFVFQQGGSGSGEALGVFGLPQAGKAGQRASELARSTRTTRNHGEHRQQARASHPPNQPASQPASEPASKRSTKMSKQVKSDRSGIPRHHRKPTIHIYILPTGVHTIVLT